jgi:hypothetical protein
MENKRIEIERNPATASESPSRPQMYRKTGNLASFAGKRFARRELFGHRVIAVPKQYPDAQFLLERRGIPRHIIKRGQFYQLNLYSTDFYGLPDELFTDPEINWHHQQFGQKGLIAAAGLWVRDSVATVTTLQSDICQQLYRHKRLSNSCKTQVETHFKYWYGILFNAVMDFCLATGVSTVHSPTGRQIVAHTQKQITPDLFLRIYDYPQSEYQCRRITSGEAEYWEIPVKPNAERIAVLQDLPSDAPLDPPRPRICIFHDIEENVDTPISSAECVESLTQMLKLEKDFGVTATYCVLGTALDRKRGEIISSNPCHAIGFHSFNHDLGDMTQLRQCREVDLRVRGYRPPQSKMTPELTDYNLSFLNFEWLASGSSHGHCMLENGIVKVPIHYDDYPLFTGAKDYAQWESDVLELARGKPLFGLGLHDCYAGKWLDRYPLLLEKLASSGQFVNADQVCDETFLDPVSALPAAAYSAAGRRSLFKRVAGWLMQ